MMNNEEREIGTDAYLDDFDDWEEEDDRWKPGALPERRRDRRSAFHRPGGSAPRSTLL